MPTVEIRDLQNVYVDGVNYGALGDAIVNNPAIAPALHTALVAYYAALEAEVADLNDTIAALIDGPAE